MFNLNFRFYIKKIIPLVAATVFLFSSSIMLTGCGGKETSRVLPPDVYYKKALYASGNHDYNGAVKNFKALIENYPSYRDTLKAELKLGDAYYLEGKFIEANGAYMDFINLHPRSKYVPFAMFFAAMSDYKREEAVGRTQEPIIKAKKILEKLISSYPDSKYSGKAFKYIGLINGKLAENEFFTGLYYYNASQWKPAVYMFKSVLNDFPNQKIIPRTLYYLSICYGRLNDKKNEDLYRSTLLSKYPDSRYAKMSG